MVNRAHLRRRYREAPVNGDYAMPKCGGNHRRYLALGGGSDCITG